MKKHSRNRKLADEWKDRMITRLQEAISCGLSAPSGAPICCCQNIPAVRAGVETACWYCGLRAALDYDGRE